MAGRPWPPGSDQADFVFHLAGVNRPEHDQEFFAGNVGADGANLRSSSASRSPCPPAALVVDPGRTRQSLRPQQGSRRVRRGRIRRQSGAHTCIYRLANVFGKWCRPNYNSVVATFCHNIARDLPITISDPSRMLTLVYVDDVMRHFVGELAVSGEGRRGPALRSDPRRRSPWENWRRSSRQFRAGRNTLQMPDFTDPFMGKLYATYLSYLPEDDFAYGLDRKCDARGCLAEFVKLPAFGQIFVSRTAPGVTRGNHYHHTKTEKFLVLEGEAIVRFRRLDGDDVIEYRVAGTEMRVVDIPPGYTHSLENIGAGELVTLFWASEIFDPAQPDTYALPVVSLHA